MVKVPDYFSGSVSNFYIKLARLTILVIDFASLVQQVRGNPQQGR